MDTLTLLSVESTTYPSLAFSDFHLLCALNNLLGTENASKMISLTLVCRKDLHWYSSKCTFADFLETPVAETETDQN